MLRRDAASSAALPAVDDAEAPENRDRVFAINAEGTRNIAEAAGLVGAKLIYISTNYVFDGRGTEPRKADDKSYTPLEIYRQDRLTIEVIPVTTAEYELTKAKRPLNNRLNKQKLEREGFTPLPGWKDALHRYLLEAGEISI